MNVLIGKAVNEVHLRVSKSVKPGKMIHLSLRFPPCIHSLIHLLIPGTLLGILFLTSVSTDEIKMFFGKGHDSKVMLFLISSSSSTRPLSY